MIRFFLSFVILAIVLSYVATYIYNPVTKLARSEKKRIKNRMEKKDKNE